MRRVLLLVVVLLPGSGLALLLPGCGLTWRPTLSLSVQAVDASRTSLDAGRSASRWDVRAEATFALAPFVRRTRFERDELPVAPVRDAVPCVARWTCAWERAARERAIAGALPALLEESR